MAGMSEGDLTELLAELRARLMRTEPTPYMAEVLRRWQHGKLSMPPRRTRWSRRPPLALPPEVQRHDGIECACPDLDCPHDPLEMERGRLIDGPAT